MSERIAIVANPAAGRGRGTRVTARVIGAVGSDCPIYVSSHTGDESRCVAAALSEGATTIIAVGGDGTWSRIGAALVERSADCRLALVAAGTGNDFAKSVGASSGDVEATVLAAREGPDIAVDVLRIGEHYCINVAGFGFDAHVLANVRPVPLLTGDALYIYSALRELFAFRGIEIDTGSGFRNHLILAVCNGARFGGQFHIAPNARLDDGEANVIAIRDASPLARISLFSSVIAGKHLHRPDVAESRVDHAVLRFREPPVFEIDGELHRASSSELSISVQPRALRVVTTSTSVASRLRPAAP